MSFQPLSVEQLHTMTADAGYDTPARKKGPPLTPRSSEACSAMGILPSELMPKPLAAFRQNHQPGLHLALKRQNDRAAEPLKPLPICHVLYENLAGCLC